MDAVTLICNEVTNDEVISYEWYFNGVIQEDETGKTFIIGNTRASTGTYACQVLTQSRVSTRSEDKCITFLCK